MGLVQMQCSNPPAALPWFKAALEAQPQNPQCWLSYAGALLAAEQADEARQVMLSGRAAGLDGPAADLLEARIIAVWANRPDLAALRALAEAGRFDELVTRAEEQIARFGEDIALLNLLAEALLHRDRAAEALPWLEKACVAAPDADGSWLMRGLALNRLKRFEAAYGIYLKVWARVPNDAFVRASLGRNLVDAGFLEEACIWLALGFERAPGDEALRNELVQALTSLGYEAQAQAVQAWNEQEGVFDTPSVMLAALGLRGSAGSVRPGRRKRLTAAAPAAERNRVMALFTGACNAEMAAYARELVERYPLDDFGWKALGVVTKLEKRVDWALIAMLLCVAAAPDDVEALCNLATLLRDLDRPMETEIDACARRALSIDPSCVDAYRLLGAALARQNRLPESDANFQRALELKPELHEVRSALLFSINRSESSTHELRVEKAREFGRRVQVRPKKRFASWDCMPHPQRLRVGIVSGDLRTHPVGHFLESVLAHLDSARLEVFAYPTTNEVDALSERIRPRFAAWRAIKGVKDEAVAQRIRDDQVHILLDLAGHTSDNRLPVFAYKPAPVQASWLGYFATTGIPQMDYVLADPYVAPAEDAGHFVERLWRLPESYLCFSEPEHSVEAVELPALKNGFVTFGCFNNLSKMNDAVVAQRAKVLQAVPGSQLFLKTKLLDNPAVRQTTRDRFAAHGIEPERLVLEAHAPRAELLAAYNRVDIALDTFPYPGGTTSVEALWMAVPVLTRRGDSFLSRLGESICLNAGLPDWIASDEDEYVRKAVAFAQDLPRLARLRAGLRTQVLASPLFDAPRFARHFEDAMWGMWQGWMAREGRHS
jgi:predicted O-linked N-acetylglucosamine transferase (SPINDLY family)/thioredoxin-like negative regulator of GroEL